MAGMVQPSIGAMALPHTASNTLTLHITGMTCASCVARVEKAIQKVPGVQQASVNLATSTAQAQRLAGSATDAALPQAVLQAMQHAGYEATLPVDDANCAAPPAAPNTDPG